MWSVEQARLEDAEAILTVQREAFAENQRRYQTPLPELAETVSVVAEAIEQDRAFVAREGDHIIGSVRLAVHDRQAEVSHLAVLPAYAHLAVGRSLMARAEEVACARAASQLVLRTRLLDAPAIEFYLKLGYRPVRLEPDEVKQLDQVVFVKSLSR